MASASVSPAVAQPGNSGNTADQRLACGSNSTNNRNFITKIIAAAGRRSNVVSQRAVLQRRAPGLLKPRDIFGVLGAFQQFFVILDILRQWEHYYGMNKVEQVENELRKLSSAELRQVRDWLDDFVEGQMKFTPEFEAAIRQSESEMKSGARPRARHS
jgi:hypothetical protein